MNQWCDRIKQFLPEAKIGLIQSNKLQIEGCDIVIGMLQSISQRSYPEGTFDSFGLNVLDEVHNFSANCFSKSLPKISTQYNLGLSATVKRKDEMEKILHWYIRYWFKWLFFGQTAYWYPIQFFLTRLKLINFTFAHHLVNDSGII